MTEPPRVAYLIASHTNVAQVVRLVRRIRRERPDAPILIHHDRSATPFPPDLFAPDERVRFVEKWVPGAWGTFAQGHVVINAIAQLLESGEPFDWLAFMSGQDYPTGSLVAFEGNLENYGDGAIVYDDERPESRDRYRFAWYYVPYRLQTRLLHRIFYVLGRFTTFQPFIRFMSGRVGCRFGILRRRPLMIDGIRTRKGFQWWTLSRRCVEYIDSFCRERPDYVDHFSRRVLIPDEAFFQTILADATFTLVSDDGHYVRWPTPTAMNPAWLGIADLPEIIASGKPFARKFDATKDSAILNALDARAGM